MRYLESITLTNTNPCLAEPGKLIVTGQPSRSLEEIIPYLATLPGVIAFNPEVCTLTFRRQPGLLSIYPDKVHITQVDDVEEGLELFRALTEAINTTWEHRFELVAVKQVKRTPQHLDIWTLLPQTNCKLCGEATCLAFAVGLLQNMRELEECLPLQKEPGLAERKTTLQAIL
jgi:ArsR family metal-binding transcriptional regulator